jgi:hypothetical protein
MSRPVGTAMQAKPGTDMACGMIRPEGLSRPVGTATEHAFVPRGRDASALQRRPQVSLRAPIPGFVNMPEMGQLANEFYSQSAVLTPEERLEALRAAQRLVTFALTKDGWLGGLASAEDIDQRVAALAKSRSAGRINDVRRALQRMERYGGDTKKVVWPLTITFLAAFLADIRRVNYDKSGSDQRGQAAERVLSCAIMPFRFARVNRCACSAGSDKELCDLRSRTRARSASREERVKYAVGTLLGLRRRGPVRNRRRPPRVLGVGAAWKNAAAGLHLFLLKGLLPGVALWGKPWVRRLQARGYPVFRFSLFA